MLKKRWRNVLAITKKAKENIEEEHNAEYYGFSTLQYFEEYIYTNKDTN